MSWIILSQLNSALIKDFKSIHSGVLKKNTVEI